MDIQIIDREDDFFDLRASWNALSAHMSVPRPFFLHEWIWTWWKAFGDENGLQILRFKENGRDVGFAPLQFTRMSRFGVPLKALTFLANAHSNEAGFIVADRQEAVYPEFFRFLKESQKDWDLIFLELLDEAGDFVEFVKAMGHLQPFCWGFKPSIGSPVVELPGSFEEYLNSLSRKSRYNVRKKKRKLEEVPGFEIRHFFDVWDLEDFWKYVEEIEKESWKFKEGKDLLSRPEVKGFYKTLIRTMASLGHFRGFVLFLQEKPVAYEMAFEYRGELYSQKIAYDAAWAHASAGFVLKTEVIRWATEHGLVKNHLLGDVEPWKLQLNGKLQPHVHLKLYSPGLRTKMVAKAEFEGIKKLGQMKRSLIEIKRVLL